MNMDNPYMTGKLLLAMPAMSDPRFKRAVIYICAHDEKGAMGLKINETLADVKFQDLLTQLKVTSDIKVDPKALKTPVMNGGPVETQRGFLLHSGDFSQSDTIRIDERFSVTGTVDALKALAKGEGPKDKIFVLGYAGWGAGQLDQELQQNAWLIVDADENILFESDPAKKWDAALAKLGINPAMLSGDVGRA